MNAQRQKLQQLIKSAESNWLKDLTNLWWLPALGAMSTGALGAYLYTDATDLTDEEIKAMQRKQQAMELRKQLERLRRLKHNLQVRRELAQV